MIRTRELSNSVIETILNWQKYNGQLYTLGYRDGQIQSYDRNFFDDPAYNRGHLAGLGFPDDETEIEVRYRRFGDTNGDGITEHLSGSRTANKK